MNILAYKTTILSRQALRKFLSSFFHAAGAIAVGLGVLDILYPQRFNLENQGLYVICTLSFICALGQILFPKLKITRRLSTPDTCVTIKVGDLFDEKSNLVIGMSDVFDTEKGHIIKPQSIQGQFLTKIYGDNRTELDNDLSAALTSVTGQADSQKLQGKNVRYPIGTVATLSQGSKKYFCSAYSFMANDVTAQSDISLLTKSLEMLWETIRLNGQRDNVAMAVLGSDLARIGNTASHSNLIKLIVSSFILTSRKHMITEHLTIVIYEKNLEKVNMLDLDDFLQNF